MGGPIKKDKAFFFGSIQRYSAQTDPTGPVANAHGHQPALQHEVHAAAVVERHDHPGHAVRRVQRDRPRRLLARGAGDGSARRSTEDAPEWVWNAQWRKVFGSEHASSRRSSPATAGYYYLDPVDPSPFTYDADTDEYCRRRRRAQYYADRSRNQVQASLTKYAEQVRHATR